MPHAAIAENSSTTSTASTNPSPSSNLDLSSSTASISGSVLGNSSVSINVGGSNTVVGNASSLTPAMYLAAMQVISSGHQSLTLNASGQAVGGTFQLPAGSSLGSLVVPTGVTGVYDFAAASTLNLSGSLTNSGNFYLVSSSHAVNSGVLNAYNIINNQGALLSSILPASGLAGYGNFLSNFSFSLNAVNNIINNGSISSSAALNLSAGNQIVNGAAGNLLANISAVNNLNMIAPSIVNQGQISSTLNSINIQAANMLNSGLLQSLKGDINISNLIQNVLAVNNVGGLISADDKLSFTNELGTAASKIILDGGALHADSISFSAGKGLVQVSLEDSSAKMNFSSRTVSLAVSNGSDGLDLSGLNRSRSVELSYNGVGDVSSSGFRTRGRDLSINTSGDIKFSGNIVTSPSGSGDAGSVLLQSGGSISVKNINAVGKGSGNGGDIKVLAASTFNANTLNSSGGADGNPGEVSIQTGTVLKNGNVSVKNITANGVNGGGVISISTPDSIKVSGALTAIDGTVNLSSSSTNIASINVGSDGNLNINPYSNNGSSYVLDLSQLAAFGSGNLSIGGADGLSSNIVLKGDCNLCLANLTSVSLKTSGSYDGSGTILTLADGQSFSVSAAAGIKTGTVIGQGQNINFSTNSVLNVNGSISDSGGELNLQGSSFVINAPIQMGNGSVSINANGSTQIEGSQLANINAANLNINSAAGAGISISGTANLSNVQDHVSFNLGGDFNAANSAIILADNSTMSVNAQNIHAGKVTGGSGLNLAAQAALTVNNDLQLKQGALVLNADLSGKGAGLSIHNGLKLSADDIELSTIHGDIDSGASLDARSGSINIASGKALWLQDNSQLRAAQNLDLTAHSDIAIGSNSKLSAGSFAQGFDPFSQTQTVALTEIGSKGKISIDNYLAGLGSGDLNLNSGTELIASGDGSLGSGSIGLVSGGNINVSGSKMAAVGGVLWLSAGPNLNLSASKLISLSLNNSSADANYSGGMIGIMAGVPSTNMPEFLSNLAASRSGTNTIDSAVSLSNTGNSASLSNGSLLSIVASSDKLLNLNNNNLNLNGGLIFIDPPPSATVNVSGTEMSSIGPQLSISGAGSGTGTGTGSGTGTGVGTGSGTGSGSVIGGGLTGTGSIVPGSSGSTLPSSVGTITLPNSGLGSSSNSSSSNLVSGHINASSVSANDISSRNSSSSQSGLSSINGHESTGTPLDTLDESPTRPSFRPAIFCSKAQVLKTSDSVDEDSWVIASSSCQPFTFEEHDGSLIVGTGPAKFAPAQDRTLLLKEGKLLVITVDRIHVVRTPFCNITVPVNTASIVEVDPQGLVRIANLAGGKTSITVCRNDETLILSAAPGEQLVLAESGLAEEQFQAFAFPEVSHTKVASWNLELSGLRGQKIKFDRQEMAQHEPLLHCSMGCVNQVQLRRIEQLMQSMNSQEGILKSMILDSKDRKLVHSALRRSPQSLRPVAYQNSALLTAPLLSLNTVNAGTATVKYTGRCRISMTSPGLLVLEGGEALVSASRKTVVKIGAAHVELKAGTVAILGSSNSLVKVRNVYEKQNTGVLATIAGKKVLGLQVGQELIVGPKGISLSRALSADPVGRRRLSSLELGSSGHSCISSEFSLSSLMQNSRILAELVRSENYADRELAQKIMKMAVCISIVTSSHGNYSMVNP
ncbi:MAG: hypothetical protein K2X27_15885 [Candidatus Obscuribacterales bacterium]|nr:hypothetical protein [Candidatus Obscuribacterales bacterium]